MSSEAGCVIRREYFEIFAGSGMLVDVAAPPDLEGDALNAYFERYWAEGRQEYEQLLAPALPRLAALVEALPNRLPLLPAPDPDMPPRPDHFEYDADDKTFRHPPPEAGDKDISIRTFGRLDGVASDDAQIHLVFRVRLRGPVPTAVLDRVAREVYAAIYPRS